MFFFSLYKVVYYTTKHASSLSYCKNLLSRLILGNVRGDVTKIYSLSFIICKRDNKERISDHKTKLFIRSVERKKTRSNL